MIVRVTYWLITLNMNWASLLHVLFPNRLLLVLKFMHCRSSRQREFERILIMSFSQKLQEFGMSNKWFIHLVLQVLYCILLAYMGMLVSSRIEVHFGNSSVINFNS